MFISFDFQFRIIILFIHVKKEKTTYSKVIIICYKFFVKIPQEKKHRNGLQIMYLNSIKFV